MTAPLKSETSEHPRRSLRLLSYDDLRTMKGIKFSRQWIRELIKLGKFPKPINSGAATTDFLESEVDEYLEALIAARDAATTSS
jgi:prophage regulatory protein